MKYYFVICILFTTLLTACGQTGPLYLPIPADDAAATTEPSS